MLKPRRPASIISLERRRTPLKQRVLPTAAVNSELLIKRFGESRSLPEKVSLVSQAGNSRNPVFVPFLQGLIRANEPDAVKRASIEALKKFSKKVA